MQQQVARYDNECVESYVLYDLHMPENPLIEWMREALNSPATGGEG